MQKRNRNLREKKKKKKKNRGASLGLTDDATMSNFKYYDLIGSDKQHKYRSLCGPLFLGF